MHFIQQHILAITGLAIAALLAIIAIAILVGFGVAVGAALQEAASKKLAARRERVAFARLDVVATAEHSTREASRTREEG